MPRVLFDDFLFVLVVLVVIVVNLSKVFVYAAYFFAGVLVLVLVLVGLTKLAAAVDFFAAEELFGVAFLADDEVLFDAEAGAAAFAFGSAQEELSRRRGRHHAPRLDVDSGEVFEPEGVLRERRPQLLDDGLGHRRVLSTTYTADYYYYYYYYYYRCLIVCYQRGGVFISQEKRGFSLVY